MEAIRRQDPRGTEEQDPPWKAPQARARDDEISTDAIWSSWRQFSTGASMGHVYRVGSVGQGGDRGAGGQVMNIVDRRQVWPAHRLSEIPQHLEDGLACAILQYAAAGEG